MAFSEEFSKTAEKSLHSAPWSKQESVGGYAQRYHPMRRRWSCSCKDFLHRREKIPDTAPVEDKYCKHIRAHLFNDSPHHIRALDIATGYKLQKGKYLKKDTEE